MYSELLGRASHWYRESLKTAPRCIRYLKSRGVTLESIERYGLGYAPPEFDNLKGAFPAYEDKALELAGLVKKGDKGRYDRFRDRLMFPISNVAGEVIGFGGRLIDGEGAKYLNSPQTACFDKGNTLFGLSQALPFIEQSAEVIVAEGYMDVLMSSQNGVSNIVATLGTATTEGHVAQLLALPIRRVVFCFDGDAAGRKAAVAAMQACVSVIDDASPEIAFAFMPAGEDPDSFVCTHGAEAFRRLLSGADKLEVFLLRHWEQDKDLSSCEGRAHLAFEALNVLPSIQHQGMFRRLLQTVSVAANLTVAELLAFCQQAQASVARKWSPDASEAVQKSSDLRAA